MPQKIFTPDDPALPMNYPGFVYRKLSDDGFTARELLADTGLDEARLNDPHFRCGFRPLHRLFVNAIALTGDPHLGVKLASQFQPTYIGIPAYTAMNAACFKDGLDVLTRFFFLNFPAFDICLIEEGGTLQAGDAAIRLRPKFHFGEIEYFGIGSAIVAINGLMNAMLRIDQVATCAEMAIRAPDTWNEVDGKIGFPVRFGAAENQIIFSRTLLDHPLPGADPFNHARLLGLSEQIAAEMAFETTPVTQVMAILDQATFLTVTLSDVAAELGYSERGLRRQLERSGTSYRKLLDQVREQRARNLLSSSMQPIKAIAGVLGFESSSNFARSFKRWTGVTPKAYRESALDQDSTDRK